MGMLKSRLKDVLKERGLKAEQMGIAPTIISRWANDRGKPSVEKLFELARVIGCKVDDLYDWKD